MKNSTLLLLGGTAAIGGYLLYTKVYKATPPAAGALPAGGAPVSLVTTPPAKPLMATDQAAKSRTISGDEKTAWYAALNKYYAISGADLEKQAGTVNGPMTAVSNVDQSPAVLMTAPDAIPDNMTQNVAGNALKALVRQGFTVMVPLETQAKFLAGTSLNGAPLWVGRNSGISNGINAGMAILLTPELDA
jgi:hypothetical protein